MSESSQVRLLTVGHGTLPQDAFVGLVLQTGVATLVDVRRFPGSRRWPHFHREAMQRWLGEGGIAYVHAEDLGGRRRAADAPPNTGLRNAAFRGYADHMATPAFSAALDRLVDPAAGAVTAVLCAESVWWRCHRRLLADAAVLMRGVDVVHLFHDGRVQTHPLTDGARLCGGVVVYQEPGSPVLPGL